MPKINFLRQKLGPVERTQTDRHTDTQTDRDSKNRRTYRIFWSFFLDFFIDERSNSYKKVKNEKLYLKSIICLDFYQRVSHEEISFSGQ